MAGFGNGDSRFDVNDGKRSAGGSVNEQPKKGPYPWGTRYPRLRLQDLEATLAKINDDWDKAQERYENARSIYNQKMDQYNKDRAEAEFELVNDDRIPFWTNRAIEEGKGTADEFLNSDGTPNEFARKCIPKIYPKVFKKIEEDNRTFLSRNRVTYNSLQNDAQGYNHTDDLSRDHGSDDQFEHDDRSNSGQLDISKQGHGGNTDQFHKQPNDPQGRGLRGDMYGTVKDKVPNSNGNAGGSDTPRSSEKFRVVKNL